MDKMKMHSPDLTQDNIAKIGAAFPDCVTEAAGADGTVRLAVDFDQLRQALSDHIVEGPQERYRLDWPGKREALLTANAPIAKTLRPARDESVDFDTTQNLFIEGDNLDALKLLQESYLGKVKMIYIDPPYNTGNDFIYADDFSETTAEFLARSNQTDEEGGRLVANSESNGRFHSDWLSMMYARLKLCRNLLSDNGVIFISIDDNEISNMRKACDDIFGESNFIGIFVIKSTPNARDYGHVGKMHEYCIFYGKNSEETDTFHLPDEGRHFSFEDKNGSFNIHPLYNSNIAFHKFNRPNLYYPFFVNPAKRDDGFYEISLDKKKEWIEVFPPLSIKDSVQFVWRWGKALSSENLNSEIIGHRTESGNFRIVQKMRHSSKIIRSMLLEKEYSSRRGTAEVESIFNKKLFSFPKPMQLMSDFSRIATECSDIVLDIFCGSATTAHAVIAQNAADGGNRKFIMVQLPEETSEKSEAYKAGYKTIAEISKERIRRAGAKIVKEAGDTLLDNGWNKDVGFRVLKVDSSNMNDVFYRPDAVTQANLLDQVDSVKQGRSGEDLLFQLLIDWGLELTLPITRETLHDKTVYAVDGNALIACFDAGVTDDLVKTIAARAPLRAVFRDTSFPTDAARINAGQLFRQLSPTTDVKAI
jgi:adenine-specific DNA-methyltransferase